MKKIYTLSLAVILSCIIQNGYSQCWKAVSAGEIHTLALDGRGGLWAWGGNNFGQLGDNSVETRNEPVPIDTINRYQFISAGIHHSFAIKEDGTLWGWGRNTWGIIGDGTEINRIVPVQVGTDNDWKSVNASRFHTIGIKTDGTIWTWGNNGNAQLGNGSQTAEPNTIVPTQVGEFNDWKEISAGDNHSIAIKTDGTIWVWGSNVFDALGSTSLTVQTSPIQLGLDSNWVKVSAGENYNLVIKNNGTLWGWGRNFFGQIGSGNTEDILSPTQIGEASNWESLSTEIYHSAAINSNGEMHMAGSNLWGQLGYGNTDNNYNLTSIENNWLQVSAGVNHTVAIAQDGSLWAWGNNSNGQIGDSTFTQRNAPVLLSCEVDCANSSTDVITACESYMWIDENLYTSSNNTATYVMQNSYGCDSTITLNLTIQTVDNTTSLSGSTLTAAEDDAEYQWLDCDNKFAPIEDETSQSFTPTQNGNYAVEITSGDCTVMSACTSVTVVSLNEKESIHSIGIYPNPAKDVVMLSNISSGSSITIYDIAGKIIYSIKSNSPQVAINTSAFANGIYQIQIENHGNFERRKFVVNK